MHSPEVTSSGENLTDVCDSSSGDDSAACDVNVTLLDALSVPRACRRSVAALLSNCSTEGPGLPVCPASESESHIWALNVGSYSLLVVCLLVGLSFNALSAMTLLRTRCLKTLCNRLVLIFCLVDTALSLLFPTIQLVSWTVKESSQAAELAWLAELTCAPRRFVYEVSTNARFSLVVSIALLRYLVVCRSINPAPTQRNILRASLPGLALALARTINNQLTLTSYCSQAYAVTESGFLIPSLSYNINTNISSMTNGFRILTLGGGILIIVFCYGSIAVKTITTRLRVRRSIARQKRTLMRKQSNRISLQTMAATNDSVRSQTTSSKSGSSSDDSSAHTAMSRQETKSSASMPPVEDVSQPRLEPTTIILDPSSLQQDPRTEQKESTEHRQLAAGSSKDDQAPRISASDKTATTQISPKSQSKEAAAARADSKSGPPDSHSAPRKEKLQNKRRSQFGPFLTIPSRQTPQLRPAPAPAGPSSAAPEAASSVPVLRVSALNYDVMTSVTLLLHLMVFMLAFLPTVLAMSLLFDRHACYQTPLQHQVLSFCLILLFLVQTSLNTPLLLLFSGQFRAALRALLRDIASKLR